MKALRVLLLAMCFLTLAAERAIAQGIGSPQSRMAFTELSFYVGAHGDDWQLFRGNAAYDDLAKPMNKVVFIYATAGDAGRTDGWWEARERGAVAAVRKGVGPAPLTITVLRFNDHPILRYVAGNSVSYFLRLPDGQYGSGKGYPAFGNESLSLLRDEDKPVTAVDKSTTYKSWKDFVQTLHVIMDQERAQVLAATHPRLNAPDYFGTDNSHKDCGTGPSCNPCDHPDHKAVSDALRQFAGGTYDRAWWVGYDTMNRPENLKGPGFVHKGEVFLAYGAAVSAETTANGNPARPELEEWQAWGARDYARSVPWDRPDRDEPHCGP